MAQQRISVVIPCLNAAKYINDAIDSVLCQKLPVECVVVDGGSTDGTVGIIKSFGDRIKWVSEKDNGHAQAINKGWSMCHGDILTWLNSDDMWAHLEVSEIVSKYFCYHNDVDVMYGRCREIDKDGEIVGWSYFHEWDLKYAIEHCDYCIPQPAAFIKRVILEKVGWLDEYFNYCKDHELWLRIALNGGVIKSVANVLGLIRNTRGLSQNGLETAVAKIELSAKHLENAIENIPELDIDLASSNIFLSAAKYYWYGGKHFSEFALAVLSAFGYQPQRGINIGGTALLTMFPSLNRVFQKIPKKNVIGGVKEYWEQATPMKFVDEKWDYEWKRQFRYNLQNYMHDDFKFGDYKGKQVLEVGCGSGIDAVEFAKNGASVTAIDITDNAVALTQGLAKEAHVPMLVTKYNGREIPFQSDSFDCVYSYGVLHHIPEVKHLLAEIYRVLKVGGVFTGMLYHRDSLLNALTINYINGLGKGHIPKDCADTELSSKYSERIEGCPYTRLYGLEEVWNILRAYRVREMVTRYNVIDLPEMRKVKVNIPDDYRLGWHIVFKARK